jgi:hypothetical protein
MSKFMEDMVRVKKEMRAETQKRVSRPEPIKRQTLRPEPVMVSEDQYDVEDAGGSTPRYKLWFTALFSVVVCLFAISFLFSKAFITVSPRTKTITLSQNFSAVKDGKEDTLPFDLVVISGEESGVISEGVEKDVKETAKGTVMIYNTFSSAPQPLAIDTRLEGSNGKIYKTKTKTTVPGKKANGAPGSVEVSIYASEPGDTYNSGPLDFKIFGFKGTPKYTKFYARSKGDIKGGFIGKSYAITDAEKSQKLNELKLGLQAKLLSKASEQLPAGFVLFKDAVYLNIESENVDSFSTNSNVPLSVKGTLYGFLFDEKKLTKKIAENTIPDYDDSPVSIPSIKDLTFYIPNKESISFKDVRDITFNVSGTVKVVWDVDTEKLINDTVGKRKKEFSSVLRDYPNIDSAELTVRPAWRSSLPDNAKDFKVIINYPK